MDQDLMVVVKKKKHSCKLCLKSFPSGRSLGGHMRSHVTANNISNYSVVAAASEDVEVEELQPGYRLRENPKKTWRISDDSDSMSGFEERQCKVCRREFQSLKALFGHMKSHSEKGREVVSEKEEEEEEEEGEEEEDEEMWSGGGPHIARKRRRSRWGGSGSGPNSSSSSVSEFDKEHEDVAISLMMLSRDVGFVFGLEHGCSEDSQKKKKVDLLEDDSDTDYFDSAETASDDSFKKQKKPAVIQRYDSYESILIKEPEMRSVKYECTTCKKSFDTYHALGGHRASHKRMKGCSLVEVAPSSSVIEKSKGNYKCHICGKVFGSGQALGGHKRSHLVMASPAIVIQKEEEEEVEEEEEEEEEGAVVLPELLDLNLPAPIDEDSNNAEFSPW